MFLGQCLGRIKYHSLSRSLLLLLLLLEKRKGPREVFSLAQDAELEWSPVAPGGGRDPSLTSGMCFREAGSRCLSGATWAQPDPIASWPRGPHLPLSHTSSPPGQGRYLEAHLGFTPEKKGLTELY